MKITIAFLLILLFVTGCSDSVPQKEDYLGVYRIIKIIENDETIKNTPLNQIELTENLYKFSIDRDGDNKFSDNEVTKSTYLFTVDKNNIPCISITGNDSIVQLLPHNYYDLLFRRTDNTGIVTTIYVKKVR